MILDNFVPRSDFDALQARFERLEAIMLRDANVLEDERADHSGSRITQEEKKK